MEAYMRHWATKRGAETPDPTPLEMPVNTRRPRTVEQMLQDYLQIEEVKKEFAGHETPEEADDFEESDPETLTFTSSYEFVELEGEEPYSIEPQEPTQEAPQEEIGPEEGVTPQVQEETPSGASE